MSKIALEGNASGTGTFTIAGPNTNTNYTITLPQETGTLATTTTAGFASGTIMLFAQTSAPTGWTKNSSTGDNSSLRVVTGSVSSGGSVDFTTVFVSNRSVTISSLTGSAGATTLTTPQIPSHTHTAIAASGFTAGYNGGPGVGAGSTGAAGGGGSHTHPLTVSGGSADVNLAVKYVDVIRATKD
jgi:hypothetical protein